MKKVILFLAGAAMLAACDDNMALPPVVMPSVVEVNSTTTVADFKANYWGCVNAPATIEMDAQGDSVIFVGRVCSTDESGNIYKNIIIQGKDADGEQVALTFAVNKSSLYTLFPFGQEVGVKATGLSIGGYRGLLQFGSISGDQMTFMAEDLFTEHVVRTGMGLPQPELVDTTVCTIADVIAAKASADQLRKWQSRLIRVQNVSFVEAGQPFAGTETTNRYIKDAEGNRLIVRNSSYASFSGEILPAGEGDVVGILSYYGSDWQILLNDIDGLYGFTPAEPGNTDTPSGTGTPEGEGTLESPYNVAKALEVIAAGPAETEVYVIGTITAIKEVSTQFGNATYTIGDKGVNNSMGVYRGYWIGGAKFTSEDQIEVGAEVVIKGQLVNYAGNTPQFTTGNQIVTYNGEGGGSQGGGDEENGGEGTEESPYSVGQIISLNPTSTQDAVQTGVWVKGYIVGSMPTGGSSTTIGGTNFNTSDAATTNLVLGPTPDCTDYTRCIGIQLGTAIRDALSLATKPENLGKELAIKGDVMKYCGGPGIKNCSTYKLDGEGPGGGGDTPIAGTPEGEGTLESPYNVAKALEVIAAGPADTEVYVTGTITAIKEVSTQYGNATYTISDKDVDNALGVYRGYWLEGAKFTATDQIAVGAEVVVKGKLVNYMGNTPQLTTGSQIVTYNNGGTANIAPRSNTRTIQNLTITGNK